MKKLLTFVLFILCIGLVNAETIDLDDVDSGSLSTWQKYNSGVNPYPTWEEITSPYDGGTAIKTSVYGNTLMNCDTKYIYKDYDLGGIYNTDKTELKAYLEFEYDGTYYNFPYVVIFVLDNNDNVLGHHLWYGKDIVGEYYQYYIDLDPASYTAFPSDKGYFTMDLSEIGEDIEYRKLRIGLYDYTCIGTNSIVIDEIKLEKNHSGSDPQEVPEFGVVAGVVALIGALGIFMISRRH